ncbi:putative transport accessory protein MmpS3 isoform X2 [Vespula squamosa]|uniref:Transport accessory protein MmpS3 isoform X2 n=1 Tax=Vespula squamosa TaxID=30214 RepID=A0ABD2BP18_VESSQ
MFGLTIFRHISNEDPSWPIHCARRMCAEKRILPSRSVERTRASSCQRTPPQHSSSRPYALPPPLTPPPSPPPYRHNTTILREERACR